MGHVTKEEIECKSCGRNIHKNELQYDSPKGRICLDCYKGKQPRQTAPPKETRAPARMPETIEGEKLLGCFRATGPRGREVLVFTPNRVFVARFPEGGRGARDAFGIALAVIDTLWASHTRRKSEERLMANLEEFLKADKSKFFISTSEIREVELKKRPSVHLLCDLKIITYGKHEWCVEGLIPEKKDVKIEDYENMLRPIFGDKLSVKK